MTVVSLGIALILTLFVSGQPAKDWRNRLLIFATLPTIAISSLFTLEKLFDFDLRDFHFVTFQSGTASDNSPQDFERADPRNGRRD